MAETILILFQVIVLIMSVVIHEVSHGLAALYLGDSTAQRAGRLTLNPLKHLDLWGSIIVPLLMIVTLGIGFGWAKPVPYNPYNLKDQKNGPALVALAGPLANLIVALVFGLAARFIHLNYLAQQDIIKEFLASNYENLSLSISGSFLAIFYLLFIMIVVINVLLAFFNLIPIPPLDGSKILFAIIPLKMETKIVLEQFGFMLLLIFIFFFSPLLSYFLQGSLRLFFHYVVGIG